MQAPPPTQLIEVAATLQQAMRQLASGVSIVTTGSMGERNGFTATSVTSLSVDPPRLLLCVDRMSSSVPLLQASGHFAVNVLADRHRDLADRFAGRTGEKGEDRFEGTAWATLETGVPALAGALAVIGCEVEETLARYSHLIVIGRVAEIKIDETGAGLYYWRGLYGRL